MLDNIDNKLNGKWNGMLEGLPKKEQDFFNKAKDLTMKGWALLKPIAIAIFLFGLFTKIRTTLGHDTVIFILLVTIVIYLRIIASKLS